MLDTKRHDKLFDKSAFDLPVHIIGVGGVGSHLAYALARLGVGASAAIVFHDGDRVEPHNLANQAYDPEHVGAFKADALCDQYQRWSGGIAGWSRAAFVKEKIPLAGVVFLCLDRMDERKRICEESIWGNPDIALLVETRMNASTAVVFALDPNDERHVEGWNSCWYPDEQAEDGPSCSGPQSIITSVAATAAFAAQRLVDFARARRVGSLANRFWIDLSTGQGRSEVW